VPKEDLASRLHRVKSLLKSLLKDHGPELRKDPKKGTRIAVAANVLSHDIEQFVKEPV
jgi:hypothetical protein